MYRKKRTPVLHTFNIHQIITNNFFRIICLCCRQIFLYNLQQFFYLRLFLIKRQSSSFYFIYNSRNAASPMLDHIHVNKRVSKSFISDLRIAFFHTLHRNFPGELISNRLLYTAYYHLFFMNVFVKW